MNESKKELNKYTLTCLAGLIIIILMIFIYRDRVQQRAVDLTRVETQGEVLADWGPGAANALDPNILQAGNLGVAPKLSYKQIVEKISPSVVSISVDNNATQVQFNPPEVQPIANNQGINPIKTKSKEGSGLIINRKGYILTNHHLIDGGTNFTVTITTPTATKNFQAEILDEAPLVDLAILQIITQGTQIFSPARIGNSDQLSIGDEVISIGAPFGLEQSASFGIVSNTNRTLSLNGVVYNGLIQTDVPINPGSSGGPLININAEVVAVNSAIYSPTNAFSGIGFAVPINMAVKAFPEFIENTVNQNLAQAQALPVAFGGGCLIPNGTPAALNNNASVPPACTVCPNPCFPIPATPAALNTGINKLTQANSWICPACSNVAYCPNGIMHSNVVCPNCRSGMVLNNFSNQNANMPATIPAGAPPKWLCPAPQAHMAAGNPNSGKLGIQGRDVDPGVKASIKTPVSFGVLVTKIFPNSPAIFAGLQNGDIIFRVNNKLIKNSKMLFNSLTGNKNGDTVNLTIFRNGKKINTPVTMNK